MTSPSSSGRAQTAAELLREVQSLLDAGRVEEAAAVLGRRTADDPLLRNARGVCLMRLGRAREAVELYQSLALVGDSIQLDRSRPATVLVNYATALLLEQNVIGCLTVLDELGAEAPAQAGELRAQIERWRKGLTRWQRFMFSFYGAPPRPFVLDGPPGVVLVSASDAPQRAA